MAQLAEKVDLSKSSVSNKELGNDPITPPQRRAFAAAFGMSIEEFDDLWRASEIPQTKGGLGIPLINKTSAGVVVNYEEWGYDTGQGYEYLDRDAKTASDLLFAVEVVGDSMMPTLREGDRVIFHPLDRERKRPGQPEVEDGDVVFVRFSADIGDGCTIARMFVQPDGSIQFRKDNPHFPPRTVPREHVVQMAAFVEFRRGKL